MDIELEARSNSARSLSMKSGNHPLHDSLTMASGDQLHVDDATLGRSSSSFSRRTPRSFSQDRGDFVLTSIRLSHERAEQLLRDVDSSEIAQLVDRGSRRVVKDEFDRSIRNEDTPGSSGGQVVPLPEDILIKDEEFLLSPSLNYCTSLVYLSFFGLLGVFTRYLLQILFGPGYLGVTSEQTVLYIALPCNILGSFLMGWFGIVFKPDLRQISDHLTLGITTGYMGSLTTFSGWNQGMLNLSANGQWGSALTGIILGMLIVDASIIYGVRSAEGIRKWIVKLSESSRRCCRIEDCRIDTKTRYSVTMGIVCFLLASLWFLSLALAVVKLRDLGSGAVLWLGCVVAPPGVWARWSLARLNG